MKRISVVIVFIFSFLVFLPQLIFVYASTLCPQGSDFSGLPGCGGAQITSGTIGTDIGKVVTILLVLAVVLALFFLIWGGIRWILSGGDKAKVTAARDTLVAAVVGLVLSLLAYAILNLVMTIVTGHGLNNFSLPTFT